MSEYTDIIGEANPQWSTLQCLAWLDSVREISRHALGEEGSTAPIVVALAEVERHLVLRTRSGVQLTEAQIVETRERLLQLLRSFPGYADSLYSVFFLKFTARKLEDLVREMADLPVSDLDAKMKLRMKKSFESCVSEFRETLDEMRQRSKRKDAGTEGH